MRMRTTLMSMSIAIGIFSISSCTIAEYYTDDMHQRLQGRSSEVQYYVDNEIILQRDLRKEEVAVNNHKSVNIRDRLIKQVIIPYNCPGVFLGSDGNDRIRIGFEKGRKDLYVTFSRESDASKNVSSNSDEESKWSFPSYKSGVNFAGNILGLNTNKSSDNAQDVPKILYCIEDGDKMSYMGETYDVIVKSKKAYLKIKIESSRVKRVEERVVSGWELKQ